MNRPLAVEAAIAKFQRYVVEQVAVGSGEWTSSQRLIQQIGTAVVDSLDLNHPPVPLGAVAHALGVNAKFAPARTRYHFGKLLPVLGRFDATVYSQVRAAGPDDQPEFVLAGGPAESQPHSIYLNRKGRFTLAHEFGHTAFYTPPLPGRYPKRIIPPPKAGDWREEGLCDAFARALLMPTRWRSAVSKNFSFTTLIECAALFKVAGEPLVQRALYDWKVWDDAILARIEVRDRVRIQLFKGWTRRLRSEPVTRSTIATAIGPSSDPQEIALKVQRHLGVADRGVLVHKHTVWAVF